MLNDDHLLCSHDLYNVSFGGDIVRRNYMLVTLRDQWVKFFLSWDYKTTENGQVTYVGSEPHNFAMLSCYAVMTYLNFP